MKPGPTNQQRLLKEIIEERDRLTRGATPDKLMAYKITFATPEGMKVLADLRASYGGISFVPGYGDVTAFNEGRRSVYDDIMTVLAIVAQMEQAEQQGG
ncbi:MAG: hypothetical protein HW377_1354 [Actinobacteria bacterium]|nr:hypothetical protein [Actinomycetota bacterium]MBM2827735.1 hypothetical protein [Actinomycetota bacterium]